MTRTVLRFHHSRPLEFCPAGVVEGVRLLDLLPEPACAEGCSFPRDAWHDAFCYDPCYQWAADHTGFWPLWLAVGQTHEDRRMTGYANQFRSDGDESPEEVLFSWADAPSPQLVFLDYQLWYLVLNSVGCQGHQAWLREIEPHWDRQIWRRSWPASRWLRKALIESHSVQALTPSLDLASADEIWCASTQTKQQLLERGFRRAQVKVKRLVPHR